MFITCRATSLPAAPTRFRRSRGTVRRRLPLLVALAASLVLPAAPAVAASNHALAVTWTGYRDTDLSFSEFFGANHTVTARFMPQYSRASEGAIVTVDDGAGAYVLGQGDYQAVPPTDPNDRGTVNLFLKVGGKTGNYPAPQALADGVWQHVAVTRSPYCYLTLSGGSYCSGYVFRVYLNGKHLCRASGSCDLVFSTAPPVPAGHVRIGRTVADKSGIDQLYGLVDDVAVFDKALGSSEIATLAAGPRLTGQEAGLLAGYTFDSTTPNGGALPASLSRPTTPSGSAYPVPVSASRDSVADRDAMTGPSLFSTKVMHLPFKPGQAWLVTQGNATSDSHSGLAAFSYDFALYGAESPNKDTNPNDDSPSCGEPIYTTTSGTMTYAFDGGGGIEDKKDPHDDDINNDFDGPNFMFVDQGPYQIATYMHMFTGSITAAFPPAALLPGPPDWGNDLAVGDHQQIATVGTRNGCHLHFAIGNSHGAVQMSQLGNPTLPYTTYPFAFWDYWSCTPSTPSSCDNAAAWQYHTRGHPEQGELISASTPGS